MRRLIPLAIAFLLVASCKKTQAPPADLACKSDDDCVISCSSRGDCCHNPYCEGVQHAEVARDADEYNGKTCTSADHAKCPQIGSRGPVTHKVVPKCQAGRCSALTIPLDGGP